MAINLLNLLGASGAAQLPAGGGPQSLNDWDDENAILVSGQRTLPQSGPIDIDAPPPPMGNRDWIEEARGAISQAPERTGMFNTRGTLRDILGVVGDAFLMQAGAKPMYAPRRQQEMMGDAMAGFTNDPRGAAERLAVSGFGKEARDLSDDYAKQQMQEAQLQSLDANRQDMIQKRAYKQQQDFGNYAARVLAAADTPEKQAFAMEVLSRRAAEYGIDLREMLGINPGDPLNLEDAQRRVIAAGDMTVNQQQQLPLRERALDISQQRADTARISATRPRAAPRPRSQTDLEHFKEISGVPENRRTPEQRAWMDKYLRSGSSARGSSRPRPLPGGTGGTSTGLRVRGVRPAN